jgi:hypothetical protein
MNISSCKLSGLSYSEIHQFIPQPHPTPPPPPPPQKTLNPSSVLCTMHVRLWMLLKEKLWANSCNWLVYMITWQLDGHITCTLILKTAVIICNSNMLYLFINIISSTILITRYNRISISTQNWMTESFYSLTNLNDPTNDYTIGHK